MNVSGRAFRAYRSSPNTATEVKAIAGVRLFPATRVKCYDQLGSGPTYQEGYHGDDDRCDRP